MIRRVDLWSYPKVKMNLPSLRIGPMWDSPSPQRVTNHENLRIEQEPDTRRRERINKRKVKIKNLFIKRLSPPLHHPRD